MPYTKKYSDFTFVLNELDERNEKKRIPVHKVMLSQYSFFEECMEMCECDNSAELEIDCNENVLNRLLVEIYNDDKIPYNPNFLDDCDVIIMCHKYLNYVPNVLFESDKLDPRNLDPKEYSGHAVADKLLTVYRISRITRNHINCFYFKSLPEFICIEYSFEELKELSAYYASYFAHEKLRSKLPRPDPSRIPNSISNYPDAAKIYGNECVDILTCNEGALGVTEGLGAILYQNNILITNSFTTVFYLKKLEDGGLLALINDKRDFTGKRIAIRCDGFVCIGRILYSTSPKQYKIELVFEYQQIKDGMMEKMARVPEYRGEFIIICYEFPIPIIPNPYGNVGDEWE